MRINQWTRAPLMAGLLGVTLAGCDDLLTVTDPQRYTSDDLDQALEAVANGVEGDLYAGMDMYVIYTALNSDEYQHTGTWIGYDDFDKGRFIFGRASGGGGGNGSDGVMNSLLQVRKFAIDAQERFQRVLEGEAATSPLMAQVQATQGWADLLIGQSFCEAPAEANGPAVSDARILEQAVAELTVAIQTAQAAGETEIMRWAQAGRARAHLLLGNYDAALADAQAIPSDFVWNAQFSNNSGRQQSSLVQLTTAGKNRAASVREKWWSQIDPTANALKDPWTGQPDARVPVLVPDAKTFGVDGKTPHYSQWKYRDVDADIPLTDGAEMRLIEAEVLWRRGDFSGAMAEINEVRTAAGLTALENPGTEEQVLAYLLHERFAELFLEGQRMSDLHRFGLVREMVARGDFGPKSEASRPTKFPMSYEEVLNNTSFSDKSASARCLPRAG